MAINPHHRKPLRVLSALAAIILGLYGLLFAVTTWGDASWKPKLGLDLEGGTQLVLQPVLVGSQKVSSDQLNQARDIIVQRVDANGVAGAEVTTRNGEDIVVSMPGIPDRATEDAIRKSSQMQFRGVLESAAGTTAPVPSTTPTGSPTGSGTSAPTPSATATVKAPATSATTKAKSGLPGAFVKATTAPTPAATATPGAAATAAATATSGTTPATTPKDPNDLAWITPDVAKAFQQLDCVKDSAALDKVVNDPKKPLVTCSVDNTEKFVLGPVIVAGDQIDSAQAGYQPLPNGQPSSTVEIQLSFKSSGTKAYGEASTRMVSLPSPRNRMAAVLDSRSIVAPSFNEAILAGQASITGNFTIQEARDLANQLKFGALPMSFSLQTRDQISPTLGSEQLRMGLIAGIIGFALVFLYSLAQYRALGFVTVLSIVIAALLTYVAISLLGWSHNFRLDMAGVTGLIVAIGVTADSFIVYFERIRDEVREGRPLRAAVDTGWRRARRTILAADGVNFLAAVVLYVLASSNVRGFAFTLGLTTLIDLLIVVMFTHPLVAVLASTKFFGGGHRWSGLDPERLGAKLVRYAGRGRVAVAQPRTATSDGSVL
ncbi:protein translocase subunit SecD [Nostocoides sp. HKS02]|uniref:protein translocase subunit SecD n=1 Tax=Nostocoides sp. HKS02 TaxID=1813880 RepID=UPI0012B470BE|nr:protein translocase subunit SecD [Tetrasphaera sp. HKS02]QGN57363.1 protein translocase subunit SecD [Tetrasphaera sp. HKS02]